MTPGQARGEKGFRLEFWDRGLRPPVLMDGRRSKEKEKGAVHRPKR